MNKLESARIKINEIDKTMASLFEERMDAVIDVITYKMENNLPIFDENREKLVVSNNSKYIENQDYKTYYEEFIKYVMDNSKKYQRKVLNQNKVSYQGQKGAFQHITCTKLFPDYEHHSYASFEDVFKAVESGDAYYGVVPFENSHTGEIGDVFDLFCKYNVYIDRLYDLKVSHNLMARSGTTIENITDVFSHPQALAQSKEFLSKFGFNQNMYANTALAAKFVSENANSNYAAVASKESAEIYGLKILAENINTTNDNTTRFAIIKSTMSNTGNKINAVFKLKHNTGALASVMSSIAGDGFNVTSIKSRSIPEIPFEYYFYIELDANLNDEKCQKMLEKIKNDCEYFKIIGCYF